MVALRQFNNGNEKCSSIFSTLPKQRLGQSELSNFWRHAKKSGAIDFFAGCGAGALARMMTNSPRDCASHLQGGSCLSKFPAIRCISLKNLTACTIGTAAQYATVYGLKEILHNAEDSPQLKAAKDGFCGIAGGLAIHPSNIAFYHTNARPELSGRANLVKIVTVQPKDFLRGIPARIISSASQWGLFFPIKEHLSQKGYSETQSGFAASLTGVIVCTPFYQTYAYQCKTGIGFKDAASFVLRSMKQQPFIATLFATAAVGEMLIGDTLQKSMSARLESL